MFLRVYVDGITSEHKRLEFRFIFIRIWVCNFIALIAITTNTPNLSVLTSSFENTLNCNRWSLLKFAVRAFFVNRATAEIRDGKKVL